MFVRTQKVIVCNPRGQVIVGAVDVIKAKSGEILEIIRFVKRNKAVHLTLPRIRRRNMICVEYVDFCQRNV